jgi:hypothetical protein
MSMVGRRVSEAAQRAAARRQREDDAPRLKDIAPTLESLKLEVDQRRAADSVTGTSHIRRIVVENAPALFIVPCADRACTDGGHDLTREILQALQKKLDKFEGQHACQGNVRTAHCGSVLRYSATAVYRD